MNTQAEYGAIPGLVPFPSKGKPKGERLRDAASLIGIYQTFKQDDTLSAKQRWGIRAMIDGQPPYKESVLRKSAQAGRSNLNFGEAQSRLNQSLTSYHDLLDSVPVLMTAELPLNILDPATRTHAQDVISNEFTTMLRDWESFQSRWQKLSKEFVEHGVGISYFPNDNDWKCDVGGWDDFLIPRNTRASEEFVDILMFESQSGMLPSELYAMIKDEAAAEDMGWNVDAVKQALVNATKFGKKPAETWGSQWAVIETNLKSNDLFYNHQNAARVYVIHAYVREYDGTYSHYIAERDAANTKGPGPEFLYKKVAKEQSSKNFFTIFCLNIGDGTYHTIRGQGYNMFPFVQTSNKLRNAVLDNVMLANRTFIQPKDVNALDESPLKLGGAYAVLSPDYDIVERTFVDHDKTTLPVLHDFAQMMEGVAPTQQFNNGIPTGNQARTKYGIQAQQSIGSALTIASVNMFYRSWQRLLREMFRRVQTIIRNQMWEDYPEVLAFAQRCAMQDVVPEIILSVERVYEKRAIGAGSPGMRQAIFDRGMQSLNTLDEVGRAQFLHDRWVADVGVRDAQRYFPMSGKPRPVLDQKIAELENAAMFDGKEVPPLGDENHTVHVSVHLPSIAESVQKLEDWRNQGEQGDIQALQPDIAYLALIIPHTEQHVQAMMMDPTRAEMAASAKKALQEYGAIWMTYVRQLEKALDEQRQEAEAQAQPDPVQLAKIAKIQADMDMNVRKFQTAEQLKVADVQSRIDIRKKEADMKMAIMLNKHNVELASELPSASSSDVVTNQRVKTPSV